jgi:nitroimidazol reductase NimA-like FMN-containing flavoprotein (pyridoxamine 5'-phosphate oxidase superfamily)
MGEINRRQNMLEKMKNLVKKNDLCVLATVFNGKPHCSLMSYLSDEEVRKIYMVSRKETQKFLNLIQNPEVSLLIDTREDERGQQRSDIKALTATGEFQPIDDPVKLNHVLSRFRKQFPHLTVFLDDPQSEIFSIRLKSFQLLDGVNDIFIETIG